ncbi:UNVERIFIED_CONTAM: hypothetical protein FKN15_053703 [Acipenser sinensis]
MDRNALAELLQALESRRDAEERRREERYTALIERFKRKRRVILHRTPALPCSAVELMPLDCLSRLLSVLSLNALVW